MEKKECMIKFVIEMLCIAMAVICAVYGGIVCANGSGTGFFVIWLFIAAVLLSLAVLTHMGWWMRVPQVVRWMLLVVVCIGLAVFVCIEGLVVSQMGMTDDTDVDYVIVLGAQVREDGPSVVLRYRLDRAISYLETHPDTVCLLSGGQGKNEPYAEAVGMAQYMEEHGVAADRLILEKQSLTTVENIRNCRELLPDHASVGIITNDFHMFRALQIAKKQGLSHVTAITAGSAKLFLPNNMLREFFAEIKFLLFTH